MASEVKTDKLSQRGSSGIVISDDIKLSSGKAIKQADGTDLLTEAGAYGDVKLASGKAIKQADGTDLLTEAGLLTPASDVKLASGTAIKNAAGTALLTQAGVLDNVTLPGGSILQVVSTEVTARNSSTSTSYDSVGTDVGLNVTLITKGLNSKFLCQCQLGLATSGGNNSGCILSRGTILDPYNGVKVGNAPDVGSRPGFWFRFVAFSGHDANSGDPGRGNHYLDEPGVAAGTSLTWKVGIVVESGTAYLNKTSMDGDGANAYQAYCTSNFTVTEIAA